MIKKNFFAIIILLISCSKAYLADLKIIVKIDDEIITNFDLIKEANYLEILNPNLSNLKKNQKLEIEKNSLINEVIKKKELQKFIKIDKDNKFLNEYMKNLYSKLSISGEEEFKNKLEKKANYSLSKIKLKINIELFWNDLIYSRYKDQVKIDRGEIISKIEDIENKKINEYSLSEIVFLKKKDLTLNNLIQEIKLSISEIGFNNTANIYSISDSSKFGGKLGWIREDNLSKTINIELKKIKIGEYTDIIKLGNNFLILKKEDFKQSNFKINKEKEVERLVKLETNKQLNKFSKIYFDKSKINYSINVK